MVNISQSSPLILPSLWQNFYNEPKFLLTIPQKGLTGLNVMPYIYVTGKAKLSVS
jgi:hypothetical protein